MEVKIAKEDIPWENDGGNTWKMGVWVKQIVQSIGRSIHEIQGRRGIEVNKSSVEGDVGGKATFGEWTSSLHIGGTWKNSRKEPFTQWSY